MTLRFHGGAVVYVLFSFLQVDIIFVFSSIFLEMAKRNSLVCSAGNLDQ
jgi:hypothetical protein